jgi:Zn-dependent alcohol dehydrogenase
VPWQDARVQIEAAVLWAPGEPLEVTEVSLDPPGPGEVLVKLAATGVCASDWHTQTGRIPAPTPTVLGHEGAGIVEEVGEGVEHVAPGDPVALSWMPACGACRQCVNGRPVLCTVSAPALFAGTQLSGAIRLHHRGRDLFHYSFLSTFATHTVVPAASAIPVRADVPLGVASLAGCAVLTGYGAVVFRGGARPGSSVLIFGAGGVGLSAVMGAVSAGAYRVIVVDPDERKRAGAFGFGATHALDPSSDDVVAAVRDLTDGFGADLSVDAVGRPDVLATAFDATVPGGTIVCVGIPGPDARLELPGPRFVREEKIVTGSLYGSSRPANDIPMLLNLYAAGSLPIDRLVTATYPLAGINDALADLAAGKLNRGVIVLDEKIAGLT